jgi:hypothetical protein
MTGIVLFTVATGFVGLQVLKARSQADAWVREMSMQISHDTTKPYLLRDSAVELHDSDCKRIETAQR